MLSVYLYWDHAHVKSFENSCTDDTSDEASHLNMSMALNKLLKYIKYGAFLSPHKVSK